MIANGVQVRLRHNKQLGCVALEACGTQFDLFGALFARHVKHGTGHLGHAIGGLKRQSTLADARRAGKQDGAAGHQAPTQHPIKLIQARRQALAGRRADFTEACRLARLIEGGATGGANGLGVDFFGKAVPGAARRALAEPFGRVMAALAAGEYQLGFVLGHGASLADPPTGQTAAPARYTPSWRFHRIGVMLPPPHRLEMANGCPAT